METSKGCKKLYLAPTLSLSFVEVEQGFATSETGAAATGGRIPSCPATAATGIDTARNTGSRPPCNPTYLLTNSLYPNENENNLLGIVVPVTGSSRLYEGCRRADTGRCNAGDR